MTLSSEKWIKEIIRKSIHLLGISTLFILYYNRILFIAMAFGYLLFYLWLEWMTLRGKTIPLFSPLLKKCKRSNETSSFAMGAVTIILACIVTAALFGAKPAAIGLSQIFVADVFASLVGMKWGKKKIFYSPSKSWVGTFSFFVVATLVSRFYVGWPEAILLGALGSFLESLPIRDWDNFNVPFFVALVAKIILHHA